MQLYYVDMLALSTMKGVLNNKHYPIKLATKTLKISHFIITKGELRNGKDKNNGRN